MARTRKQWVYIPQKPSAPEVPTGVKTEVQQKADQFVETVLKPRHIAPPPKDNNFNYIVDVFTKWYRHYFYFCAKYCSPGPDAFSPFFEMKFARMEYIGENHFNLAYMRHTGEWFDVNLNASLDQCLAAIKDDPFFHP